jgi:hypothetical protein
MIEHDFLLTVARSPEEAFDFLIDLRNAPQGEPYCREAEKTSDAPIGQDDLPRKYDLRAQEVEDSCVRTPGAFRQSRKGARDGLRLGVSVRGQERRHAGVGQALDAAARSAARARAV